jgi:hypothetical protein
MLQFLQLLEEILYLGKRHHVSNAAPPTVVTPPFASILNVRVMSVYILWFAFLLMVNYKNTFS